MKKKKKKEKDQAASELVFFFFLCRSFQDTNVSRKLPVCGMISTQHLPRPLMKLMTLALLQHTAVPSMVGKEDVVSRFVLN